MLRIAVVGLGTMGQLHLEAWANMHDVEIVGVCGRNAEKTRKVALEFRTAAYFNLSDLLNGATFDVLDVCVPTFLHKEVIEVAAKAKKHIICEKPIALDVGQCNEIMEVCDLHGVHVYPAHVLRFFPEYRTLHEQVKVGRIGKPTFAHLSRGGTYPESPSDWYAHTEKSGGLILDLMIHDFDWLLWTFGDVKSVTAQQFSSSNRLQQSRRTWATVTLEFEDGLIGSVDGSWGHYPCHGTSIEVCGEVGMLFHTTKREIISQTDNEAVSLPEISYTISPYQLQLEHFCQCIKGEASPEITLRDGIKAVKIAQAARQSLATGKPVNLLFQTNNSFHSVMI